MSYTRPPFDAADATWQGAHPYTRPAHDAADATWQPTGPATITGTARPTAYRPALTAAGSTHVVALVSAATHRPTLAATGIIAVRGALQAAGHRPQITSQATVLRYVLRGAVRSQGVLVDRTVRAHRLADGALAAEAQTVGGMFDLAVGSSEGDYYILALDLAPESTDYAPPIANRVRSVLAQDAPA